MIGAYRKTVSAILLAATVISQSVSADIKKEYDLGFSQLTSKLTLDNRTSVSNSDALITNSVTVNDNLTLAEIGSSMNCSTGDITVSAAIPEISSFKDALKILAPYAVGDDGEIDFGGFLNEMMTEFAIEESTESTLEFLAYVHYYITASMGPVAPADIKVFKTSEFSSCLKDTWAKATETQAQVGGGIGATFDDFGAQLGLDVTALFKMKTCFSNSKGPIFPSEAEEKRYEKSLKIVRAIFYKLLNGQMNFNLSQQSDECKKYEEKVFKEESRNMDNRKFLLQNAHGGQRFSPDGSVTSMPISVDRKTVIKRVDADDKTMNTKLGKDDLTNDQKNEKAEKEASNVDDGDAGLEAGPVEKEVLIDLTVKVSYRPAPYNIDITDMNPEERITLFNKTSEDFLTAVEKSSFYDGLSSKSKHYFRGLLTTVMSTQSLNYKHVEDLSCALDQDKCNLSNWLLEAEYDAVVNHNGYINKCIETETIGDSDVCIDSVPEVVFDSNGSKRVKDKAKQQKYMQHIIRLEILEMVESYYKSLGAFTFKEDFNQNELDAFNSTDYMKNKIVLLKRANLLRTYWSSPIASLSPAAILNIKSSQESTSMTNAASRSNTYRMIKDIFKGNSGSKMSITPYIYEPMNELQMAKFIHLMSDPARINLLLLETDSSGLGVAPALPLTFDKNTNTNVFKYISDAGYKSITDAVEYNGHKIHPLINNTKRDDDYASLSVDELHNLAILMEKFKDFYVKRLIDVINDRFNIFKSNQMSEIRNNSTPASIATVMNEMNVIDFKQQQKREMLKLLVN